MNFGQEIGKFLGFDPTPGFNLTRGSLLGGKSNSGPIFGIQSHNTIPSTKKIAGGLTKAPQKKAPVNNQAPYNPGMTYASGGGGGYGGGGAAQAAVDPAESAYWNDQLNSLRRLLGSTGVQQKQGTQRIKSSASNAKTRLAEDEGRVLRDYGIKRQDTTAGRDRNVREIEGNARSTNNALSRLLGLSGAGVSSAAQVLAPDAVARMASGQRSDTQDTYGRNARNLDLAEGDAKTQFKRSREDVDMQAREREEDLVRGILEAQNDINSQIASAETQKAIAGGGNYLSARGARAGAERSINQNRNALDSLFAKYRNPTLTPKAVNAMAPDLASYSADPLAVQEQQQNPTLDDTVLPYLPSLKRNQRQQYV
jgi:hypothetical protein